MPFTIALNSNNLVTSSNQNQYRYTFPNSVIFDKHQVSLQNIGIFYSWINISASNNNNTFSYVWPVGPSTVTVTIPDGYYSIADINAYLQSVMYSNNHYLTDSGGQIVYYLEITTNSTLYAVQLNSYAIPTSLPSGYTAPAGWPGYPVSASTPQFVIPSTNIQNIFGISAGTYPSVVQSTNYSKVSTTTPQINTVSSVFVLCSLLNNKYSIPNNILYNFSSAGTEYGGLIQIQPPTLVYSDIQQGTYADLLITFTDQNFNPLQIRDPNLTVLLTIREKGEV